MRAAMRGAMLDEGREGGRESAGSKGGMQGAGKLEDARAKALACVVDECGFCDDENDCKDTDDERPGSPAVLASFES